MLSGVHLYRRQMFSKVNVRLFPMLLADRRSVGIIVSINRAPQKHQVPRQALTLHFRLQQTKLRGESSRQSLIIPLTSLDFDVDNSGELIVLPLRLYLQ